MTKAAAKKETQKAAPASGKQFKVTLMRGMSRTPATQQRTLAALGLRKRHHSITIADNVANRGQIMKVQHLVTVEVLR